jgi:hypothetical protein
LVPNPRCKECKEELDKCLKKAFDKFEWNAKECDKEYDNMIKLTEILKENAMNVLKYNVETGKIGCTYICFGNVECIRNCQNIADIYQSLGETPILAAYAAGQATATAYKISCHTAGLALYYKRVLDCHEKYDECLCQSGSR